MYPYNSYQQGMAGNMQYPSNYMDRLGQLQQMSTAQQAPRCEIVHVNGENGARAFRMAPNSQCLLLDDTAPIIWLCASDGAGYHTATPFSIAPYQAQPAPDYNSLDERLTKLEGIINDKSDFTSAKPKHKGDDGPK